MKGPGWLKAFLIELRPPIAAFTAVIAAATVAYVIVSAYQLTALYQSNEGSQRAWLLIRDLTPLVPQRANGVCPILPADDPSAGPKPPAEVRPGTVYCVRLTIENAGNSPAVMHSSKATWNAVTLPEQEFFRDPPYVLATTRRSRGLIGPKHIQYLIVTNIGLTNDGKLVFDDDVVAQINSGGRRLYIYGRLDYSDPFSESRHTTFCSAFVPTTRVFDFCESYNGAK